MSVHHFSKRLSYKCQIVSLMQLIRVMRRIPQDWKFRIIDAYGIPDLTGYVARK